MAVYSQLLDAAQAQYGAIIAGYQNTLAYHAATAASIQQGYSQLYTDVLTGIKDVGQAKSQEIADTYASRVGAATQQLVNRGLGNTTVTSSVARGLALDESKAQATLAEQIAQLRAGYQSQLGLAGLGYRGQALREQTGIQTSQLGYMAGYQNMLGNLGMREAELNQRESFFNRQMNPGGFRVTGWGGGGLGATRPEARPILQQAPRYDSGYDPYVTVPNMGSWGGYGFDAPAMTSTGGWGSATESGWGAPGGGAGAPTGYEGMGIEAWDAGYEY